jgi:uncharacterized tellurite resistance protein B-like protein
MSDRTLILALAKVIIAAAWADGQVTLEETNSLKDLLFRLPRTSRKHGRRITAREWATLEIYMESPIDGTERARLVEELQATLRAPRDRELALAALDDLIHADGEVSKEELAVMKEIRSALDAVDLSIVGQLGRLIRGPIQRRTQAVASGPNREHHVEDFIKNKVYYAVRRRLNLGEAELAIPETELRKLSLAGGLMAQVAQVDQEITEDEFDIIARALQTDWGISEEAAALVTEVAVSEVSADLDFFRLTREFTTSTTEAERVRFLDVLFAVAKADGHISLAENSEIIRIASSLNLTRQQFIDAKDKNEAAL